MAEKMKKKLNLLERFRSPRSLCRQMVIDYHLNHLNYKRLFENEDQTFSTDFLEIYSAMILIKESVDPTPVISLNVYCLEGTTAHTRTLKVICSCGTPTVDDSGSLRRRRMKMALATRRASPRS